MRLCSLPGNRLEVRGEPTSPRPVPSPVDVPLPESVTQWLHERSTRRPSARPRHNDRLLNTIRERHIEGDAVMGAPRMHEELADEGETASLHRVARLMPRDGLRGVQQKRRWRHKRSGARPAHVRNRLERDFTALEPNTQWVANVTLIRTGEGWVYLCAVPDLFSDKVMGWSMVPVQDRHLTLKAVMMVCSQQPDRSLVVLRSDLGTQFTSSDYRQFPRDRRSISAVGNRRDHPTMEELFGLLKRERVHRRRHLTCAEARADVFNCIERFHNPRMQRRLDAQHQDS
jgi:putative transposase